MSIKRDDVTAALQPQLVAAHYQIEGRWHGRWMRARCPMRDHASDSLGISTDGRWHCHACDLGGDLYHLIAAIEGLDSKTDFGKVLAIAASIAGIIDEDDFGAAPVHRPPPRPAAPPLPSLAERVAAATKRATWLWGRLAELTGSRAAHAYLATRGLDWSVFDGHENIRRTPVRISLEELERGGDDLRTLARMWSEPSLAIPVRHIETGALVDVRARRYEAEAGRPKIIGMLGGVTRADGELVGCYGQPHQLGADLVVVVEGAFDYMTGLALWPKANVLGAVDAGSYALVAGFAAAYARAAGARLALVAQDDGAGGAAGKAIDAAAVRVIRAGMRAEDVGLIDCGDFGGKDLNELWMTPSNRDRLRTHLDRALGIGVASSTDADDW